MADILFSPALHLILFIGSVVFTAAAVRRKRLLFAIAAPLCTICACLLGLAAERTLEELLIAVLVPLAVLLLSQAKPKGGTDP